MSNRSIIFEDSRSQFSPISYGNSTEVISNTSLHNGFSSTNHTVSSPQYFSLHESIPVKNRSKLYTDLEKVYRSGEVCEEETSPLVKHLPDTHPLKEMLKGCDDINAIYKNPQKLKTISISFKNKDLSSQFKVVPQHRYAISTDKILFTSNVMKCVAIGIYNPIEESFGLAHVAGENIRYLDAYLESDEESKTGFHEFMENVAGATNPAEHRVTLLSGSKSHIEYYVHFMKAFGFKDFMIIQKDEWGNSKNNFYNKKLSKGSLAVDPKSGRIYRIKNDKIVNEWRGPPFAEPTAAFRLIREE